MFRYTVRALLIAVLAVGASALVPNKAEAGTLSVLQLPPQFPTVYYYHNFNFGKTFDADGSVIGSAQSTHSDPCSGRGCQPVQWTQVYNVAWDTSGNILTSILCGTMRHHRPQDNSWVYELGFDETNCQYNSTLATDTVTNIDGVSYYLVYTNGAAEIVNSQTKSYVYVF